jgi:hypothetical protein
MEANVFRFSSEGEANAFADGVEFVNDSSIEIESITLEPSGFYVVTILDFDEGENEDDEGETLEGC